MLDIGCGTGVFASTARALSGCKLHGVDGSKYALEQAAEKDFDSLSFVADFNNTPLPFDCEQFDFCLCKDLLEHLLHPDFVVEEACRVLRPGGYLLVHVPNHFSMQGRLRFLISNNIDTYGYFPGSKRWNFPHIRFFTYESLLALVEEHGFTVKLNLCNHFPAIPFGRYLIPWAWARKWMAKNYPSQFAEGLTLLVKKVEA